MTSALSPARKRVDRLAARIPLTLYSRFVRRDAIGFCYHAVSPVPLPHVCHLIPSKTPAAFESDLLYLKDRYNLISYTELASHRSGRTRLPRKSALLTFDDGYTECYSIVRPLLLKHNIPAVFFLISDCLDNRRLAYRNLVSLSIDRIKGFPEPEARAALDRVGREIGQMFEGVEAFVRWLKPLKLADLPMIEKVSQHLGLDQETYLSTRKPYLSAEQVRTMHTEGFTFGGHSRRHPSLADIRPPEAETEIVESCEAVRSITGQAEVPFAFPFSANRVDRAFLAGVRERHPWLGLFFDTKGVQGDVRFMVSRISADTPEGSGPGETNIPWLLHQAYRYNFTVTVTRFFDP